MKQIRLSRAALRLLRRFEDQRGMAAVEFALILPVMLTMYLGTAEVSKGLQVSHRLDIVSHALADLPSAQSGDSGTGSGAASVNETALQNFFTAASKIMAPMDTTNMKMTITEVAITSPSAGTWQANVNWSIAKNGGTKRACGQLTAAANPPAGDQTKIPSSFVSNTAGSDPITGAVIVADLTFNYKPSIHFAVFGWNNAPTYTFKRTAYAVVRNSANHVQYWGTTGTNCNASH